MRNEAKPMFRRDLCTLTLGLTLFFVAQAKPEEGGFRRISVPPNYLLKPGDQLEIVVEALPETDKVYQIRSDGNIQHPVAGEVKAAGKRLDEVQKVLLQRFTFSLKKPVFKLGIYSVAEIEASVVGEANRQGVFLLHTGSSVLDLLAQCGGLTNKADTTDCVLVRGDQKLLVNLKDRTELGKFKLANGDVLMVNPGKRISVTGEVREPGQFTVSFKSVNPIDDALVLAGGTKETAALQRVLLIRPTLRKPIEINLNERDDKGNLKNTVEVLDGDTVSVLPLRCAVLGGVDKPGQVILTGNESLFDIVSACGSSRGKLDQVVVIRSADVIAGSEKREVYNLEEAFTELKSIPRVPIYDGDVVFVPPMDQPSGLWGSAWNMMSVLMMARSLFAF